jgi:hypothetical protein
MWWHDFLDIWRVHWMYDSNLVYTRLGLLAIIWDSDYAGDFDGKKSTSSIVFTLGGTTTGLMSSRQKVTTLSTIEVKYIAAAKSCKEPKWLKCLRGELCPRFSLFSVHCESQVIYLARNQNTFHRRTKILISSITSFAMNGNEEDFFD